MREHFAEALVTGYEPLIGTLELPDSDDRHVLAAAIRCGAQHIVTDNLADFPTEVPARFDIEAIDADRFPSRRYVAPSRPLHTRRSSVSQVTNRPASSAGMRRGACSWRRKSADKWWTSART